MFVFAVLMDSNHHIVVERTFGWYYVAWTLFMFGMKELWDWTRSRLVTEFMNVLLFDLAYLGGQPK